MPRYVPGLILLATALGCGPKVAEPLPPDARAPTYTPPPAPPFNPIAARIATPPDTRTDLQVAQAACRAFDGRWRCGKSVPQPMAATTGSGPVIPYPWTVAHWWVDPQNTSTAASDLNSCTSSGAPCLTWQEIATHRMGCGNDRGCVRLRQTSDVTFLSAHTSNADPVYVVFALENSASFTVLASLPTPTVTSTFTSVVNWSGCATGHVNDTGQTIGTHGGFVQDVTVGANLWCTEFATTHSCTDTIPMTAATPPPTSLQTPGLWTSTAGGAGTLSSGDTYHQYPNLVAVDVVSLNPVMADYTGATPTNGAFLYHVQVLDPSGTPGTNVLEWGGNAVAYESRVDRVVNLVGTSTKDDGCVNCWLNGGLTGGRLSTGHFWHGLGGEVTANSTVINVTGLGVALDGYFMQENAATFAQGASHGLVMGAFGTFTESGYSTLAAIAPGYAAVGNGVQFCLASGTLALNGNANFRYDSSHGGSAGVFNSPTFTMSGSSTAESHSGTGTVTVTNGITVSTTNLDNAASATAFGGAAYWKGEFLGAM